VELLGGRGEPPSLELAGAARARLAALGAQRAHVSITHTETLACATVILD
jgi:phosphopantetheinyl transferase (holo-ACP synthase)